MDLLRKITKWIQDYRHQPRKKTEPTLDGLETEQQYKERWMSIYIIYFTMFLMSLGFSIILTGVWPYLDKLDPTAGKEFMGYVVTANPLGQMLFSPLVGWWSNRLGSIRLPLIASLTLFTIASGVYSSLELFDSYRKYWMLWTRFLIGVSSANVAACRSYLSAATKFSERTKAVSMISLAQVLGFVIGPAIQAVVVFLGADGVWLIPNKLKLDMFTAPGWINAFFTLGNLILFLPYFFKEHKIAAKEAMLKQGKETEEDTWKSFKPDLLSAWTLIVSFFVLVFNFMLLETLDTALTMDQFAWTKAEALYYMGILMSAGAVTACFTFATISPLCKLFSEAKVLIWGGFFFMVLGRAVYIPWGSTTPLVYDDTFKGYYVANFTNCVSDSYLNESTFNVHDFIKISDEDVNLGLSVKFFTSQNLSDEFDGGNISRNESYLLRNFTKYIYQNLRDEKYVFTVPFRVYSDCGTVVEPVGCPSSQKWCYYTPAMTIFQFLLGYALTAFGYPIGVTLIQTLFSKLLGSRPQGVWMGLMTGAGCLSRVLGPVFVTTIYKNYGTIWTFGLTTAMMAVSLVWLCFVRKRLIPREDLNENNATEMQETVSFIQTPLEET